MTLVDDPPVISAPDTAVASRRSPTAPWRFAARLARREVRRRPGRTVLVALLVAVPVVAMTVASVMYRTTNDDWTSKFERRNGLADLSIGGVSIGGVGTTATMTPDVVADRLPDGSRSIESITAWTGVELADGSRPPDVWVRFTDLPIDDPLAAGIVEVRQGRAPAAPDELLLDGGTARRLSVGVGDTLELNRPSGSWQVAGIGRLTDHHSQGLMVVHDFDRGRFQTDRADLWVLVDLPDVATRIEADETIRSLSAAGLWVENRWESLYENDRNDERVLAWGWVAGVLALAAVGIVIASAFATSARRQLVTIGHLSANGAPARLVRRTLALQGSWTGLIGVVGGMALAVIGLVSLRPVAEGLVNRSLGSYRFTALDLAVIAVTAVVAATVAAAVPARTAAKVPVLSALAGRRPLGEPSRRLVPVGVSLFLGGLGLLFVAATGARQSATDGSGNSDVFALVAVLGGLGVVFGMCCATPLAVATVGRLGGSSASGTWRLAARSTARSRTRSSGVVTAVATAGAFAVAGVTIAAISITDDVAAESLPRNVAVVETWSDWRYSEGDGLVDPPPLAPLELEPDVRSRLEQIVPQATWVTLRAAGIDPRPFDPDVGPQTADGMRASGREVRSEPLVATIADPAVLELAGLSAADEALLAEVDLLEIAPWYSADEVESITESGGSEVVLTDVSGDIVASKAVATSGRSSYPFHMLMSPERAEALGLDVVEVAVLIDNPTDLTSEQRRELEFTTYGDDSGRTAFREPGDPPPVADAAAEAAMTSLGVQMAWDTAQLPIALINTIIVALAVLFTLLVVAIGLSLSATESRDERDVLVAVGAPPRTLSRVSGAKAVVLAGTGVLLAVPTGFVPTWVVYQTVGEAGVPVPWPMFALLVLVVPAAAGLAAWATSALARRVRPVQMSTALAE